jgi:hypothetical protein
MAKSILFYVILNDRVGVLRVFLSLCLLAATIKARILLARANYGDRSAPLAEG